MASVLPSATIVKQLGKVLNRLHQTQMRKDEYLFPEMANYMNNPSEENWQIVKTTATALLNEINGAVDASIAFDAEFYKEGQNIIWIANGARQTVDRSYYQVFRTSRRRWNGNCVPGLPGCTHVLKDIIQTANRPTREQAQAWAHDLKEHYDRLPDEITRLLNLIRQRT